MESLLPAEVRSATLLILAVQFLMAASAEADEKGLTLLIHLDGYESEEAGLKDAQMLQEALDSVEPFQKYQAAVHFHFLPFSKDRFCSVNKVGSKALLKCDKALIGVVNSPGVERFKLVVLSNDDFVPNARVARGKNSTIYIPARQAFMKPAEREDWLRKIFLHELGHAFGLRDEYGRIRDPEGIVDQEAAALPSGNAAYQPARPNCAPDVKTAKEWWGEYLGLEGTGYYSGCAGRMDYVRPAQDHLMSDYAKELSYGYVSERYLDLMINCFYLQDKSKDCKKFKKVFPDFWTE